MTIQYSNGRTVDAILLARDDQRLRVAMKGSEDMADFTHVNGTWISEDLEPVQIVFEWQKWGSEPTLSESEFICSHELASRLIRSLFMDTHQDDADVPAQRYSIASGAA